MVHLTPVDSILVFLYFAAVLFVGFRASRRKKQSSDDFLLAGRTLTLPVFVATLVSTWYGGILGVGEFSYRFGVSNWVVFGLPYYFFALLFALFLAKKIRATQFATIPDQLEHVYGKPVALLGAGLTFFLVNPAAYALMLGILFQMMFGWSLLVSIVLTTALSVVFLFVGGLRSDISTNVLEFILMFLGFALMLVFARAQFGGFEFIASHVPPKHLSWSGGNSPQFILVWFLIALWTLVDPAFHQRCYAAKDERTAQRGILVSILFWAVFDFLTTATGLYARAAIPNLTNAALSYPMLAEIALPPIAKGLFYIGLLATIMSTLSSLTLIGGITIGKDIVGRMRLLDETQLKQWSNVGIAASAAVAVVLAMAIPSVVSIWYTVGTCIVPGLLLAVVSSYFPSLQIHARFAFVAMSAGYMVSTAAFVWGQHWTVEGIPAYPFGIEPMIPGLAASVLVWSAGKLQIRK